MPILEADDAIVLFDYNPLGNQYMFRMNWLHPPFDNQKVRQAALAALNQEDFLKAVIGDPRYYKTCAGDVHLRHAVRDRRRRRRC